MLSGTEGERVKKTKEFGAMLERRTGLEIVFQDERLTTVEAYEIMDEAGIKNRTGISMWTRLRPQLFWKIILIGLKRTHKIKKL